MVFFSDENEPKRDDRIHGIAFGGSWSWTMSACVGVAWLMGGGMQPWSFTTSCLWPSALIGWRTSTTSSPYAGLAMMSACSTGQRNTRTKPFS